MDGYVQISLTHILNAIGEDKTKKLLSSFCCPRNMDVEEFLRNKAIVLCKQGVSETHLVFASHKGAPRLIAYFTITMKAIHVPRKNISNTTAKRICKFGAYNPDVKCYILPSVLIAQLGKNYNNGLEHMITGDELIKLALDKIYSVQEIVGGKIVYVECEDKPGLIRFYSRHGFFCFGKRSLDKDEQATLSGSYLIQMLKYTQR